MKSILGFILLFITSFAYSASDLYISSRGDISEFERNESIEFIKDLRNFSKKLIHSMPLTIDFVKKDTEVYYAQSNFLFLPLQMGSYDDFREFQTKPKTKIIWAHEFGHAIFNQNFKQESNLFAKYFSFFEYRDELIGISHDHPHGTDANLEALNLLMPKLAFANEKLEPLIPFDELFADIFAVLYFEDPEAMVKALSFNTMSQYSTEEAAKRSFSPITNKHEDAHGFFARARKSYWGNVVGCLNKKELMLRKSYKIISKFALEALDGKYYKKEELNRKLMDSFNKDLNCTE